jgi:hypothetical protein
MGVTRAAALLGYTGAAVQCIEPRGCRSTDGAADEGPQVHLRHHLLGDQPAVGLVVGLLDQECELIVQRRLDLAPVVAGQPALPPRVESDPREHMGTQRVVGLEFLAPLEHRHPRTQIRELPRGAIHDRQRESRCEDLPVDGVVVHQ